MSSTAGRVLVSFLGRFPGLVGDLDVRGLRLSVLVLDKSRAESRRRSVSGATSASYSSSASASVCGNTAFGTDLAALDDRVGDPRGKQPDRPQSVVVARDHLS